MSRPGRVISPDRLRVAGPWLVGISLATASCGGETAESSSGDGPDAEAAAISEPSAETIETPPGYVETVVADGGVIRGTVRYAGPVPAARTFAMEDEADGCGVEKRIVPVEVGPDGGLRNAVVSIRDLERGAALRASAPTLDQRGCEFVPHIVIAAVGDTVRILNSDPVTHNVHTATFDNRSVNLTQPAGAPEMLLTFSAPERVKVQCDIHPWMSAWIIVTEHPYAAITGVDGEFELTDVPPGDHALEVWHESPGAVTRSVTVAPGGAVEVAVELTGRG